MSFHCIFFLILSVCSAELYNINNDSFIIVILYHFCLSIIKLLLLSFMLLSSMHTKHHLQSLFMRMRMRIDSAALLKDSKIHNSRCIALYNTSFHSLLNNFVMLIHMNLYISRKLKLVLKHILFQKSDKLELSHKLIICKINFFAEILEFAASQLMYKKDIRIKSKIYLSFCLLIIICSSSIC